MIPTLHTERLTLRPPHLDDFPAYLEIMQSARAVGMGGPFSQEDSWLDFCAGVAGWPLRGFGMWSLDVTQSEEFAGVIFLHHEYGDPERELGWVLTEKAEGNGYAIEGALRARAYAYETLGWDTVVSYVDSQNTRSCAVAARMGAHVDPDAPQPAGDEPCLVYRHPTPDHIGGDGGMEAYQ